MSKWPQLCSPATRKLKATGLVLIDLTAEELDGKVFGASKWVLRKLGKRDQRVLDLPPHPFKPTDPAVLGSSGGITADEACALLAPLQLRLALVQHLIARAMHFKIHHALPLQEWSSRGSVAVVALTRTSVTIVVDADRSKMMRGAPGAVPCYSACSVHQAWPAACAPQLRDT